MYLLALALTMLVEVPVYVLAIPVNRWRVAAVAVAANLLTHPPLWWVLSGSGPAQPLTFAVAEAVVCLVEGALLVLALRSSWSAALAAAVAANAASVLVGVLTIG
jgi:hypothetical protein